MDTIESPAVIIVGSSSSEGHTMRLMKTLSQHRSWDIIDLNDYKISYYDYQHKNENDDFLELINKIAEQYQTIILATPVYWYTMSGIMKVFLDRWTDLLDLGEPSIQLLKDKYMYVISNSADSSLDYPFELPFEKTAEYMGMNFIGYQHIENTKEQATIDNLKLENKNRL